jgi:menaquinone-specific isochorismate synthase
METRQSTIEGLDFTNFLASGALLSPSANLWFLLQGPFVAKKEVTPDEVALFTPDYFMGPSDEYWIPSRLVRLTTEDLRKHCQDAKNFEKSSHSQDPSARPGWEWQPASFEGFEISFQEIFTRFNQGLKKAVPIAFETSKRTLGGDDLLSMIEALLEAPPNLYVYGFWQNGRGLLGATPEVLLRQDGDSLTTMALAGTCPKEDLGSRQALMDDVKERHEHDLVAQDVVQRLKTYGDVQTQGPMLLELPSLFHLKTDIRCRLLPSQSFQFFEACKRLHPTPALGVSPRSYGIEWMRELPEQSDRRGFGAPWGLKWAEHEALCLVAIRNIQWGPQGSRVGAGCGIVAQSNLQQEWRELFQKRLSVKKVLGLQT